jgi:hypothetical protein
MCHGNGSLKQTRCTGVSVLHSHRLLVDSGTPFDSGAGRKDLHTLFFWKEKKEKGKGKASGYLHNFHLLNIEVSFGLNSLRAQ